MEQRCFSDELERKGCEVIRSAFRGGYDKDFLLRIIEQHPIHVGSSDKALATPTESLNANLKLDRVEDSALYRTVEA
jgi:hypothetical protein